MRMIGRDLSALSETNIAIFDFFNKKISKTQKCSYFYNFGRMWLANELVLTF